MSQVSISNVVVNIIITMESPHMYITLMQIQLYVLCNNKS